MVDVGPSTEKNSTVDPERVAMLKGVIAHNGPAEAAAILGRDNGATIAEVLCDFPPPLAVGTLWKLPAALRESALASAPESLREQWILNQTFPAHTVGRLMNLAPAVFSPGETVAEAVDRLRELVRKALITYGYVVDEDGVLIGVLIFRELLFAEDDQLLRDVMLPDPYSLGADMGVEAAMRSAVTIHFPEYPVVDARNRLIGLLRGQALFQQQAFELSAQPGQMVGVEAEERLNTPWHRSFRFRHPWLQLNLITAFAAAAVVGVFQDTIDRTVLLAAFLPVLAGQSGNTGCQALAVTLRGMTLGELRSHRRGRIARKEMLLGLLNGAFVGVTAGAGMFAYAYWQGNPAALQLAFVVFVSMILACVVSGLAGALIPMALKQIGSDPATASSIFLTTATDVVSMGTFLALATAFIH